MPARPGSGRRPKPTAIKISEGRRVLNVDEPQFEIGAPPCPSGLSADARSVWEELSSLLGAKRVVTKADGAALELLCVALARWRKLERFIAKRGRTYSSETVAGGKVIRPRPEVTMAAEAWREAQKMVIEFGLTPASRTKVKTVPERIGNKVKDWIENSSKKA